MTFIVIMSLIALVGIVIYASWRWWLGRVDEDEWTPPPRMVPARRPVLEDGSTGRVEAFTHPQGAMNRHQRRAAFKLTTTRDERMEYRRFQYWLRRKRIFQRNQWKALIAGWNQDREDRI